MSSNYPHSTVDSSHVRSFRTYVYLGLVVLAVLIGLSLLISGARSLIGRADLPDTESKQLPTTVTDTLEVSQQQRSLPPGQVSPGLLPTPQESSDPTATETLQNQPPGQLTLTVPPVFSELDDRAALSGDQHLIDGDWRKQFKSPPPMVPPVARASLTEITPYQEWDVHQTAADSLGRIGTAAVPSLIEALSDPEPKRRAEAAWLLGKIGPSAKQAVAALAQTLNDPAPSVQKSAARALGQIGPDAAEAVEALMRLVEQTEPIGVTSGVEDNLEINAE